MANNHESHIDRIFHALSDPTRRAILKRLTHGEATVSKLAEPHRQSLAGISKHLKVLEEAELVRKLKQGREITCQANTAPLGKAHAVLEELGAFWRDRLESLDSFLNEQTKEVEVAHEHTGSRSTSKSRRQKNRSGR